MSDSTPKFVHLSESDARDVLFAEMLEKIRVTWEELDD